MARFTGIKRKLFNASKCELVRIECESRTGGSWVSPERIRNVAFKSLVKHLGLLKIEKQVIVLLLDLTFFAHNALKQLPGVRMLFSPYLIPDLGKLRPSFGKLHLKLGKLRPSFGKLHLKLGKLCPSLLKLLLSLHFCSVLIFDI